MEENREVMGRNIKKQLELNGLSAAEVCRDLGFKTNTFSNWITGQSYPRIDKIEKMAEYFKIPKAYLVEDVEQIDAITQQEKDIIIALRNADKTTRDAILRLLDYSRMKDENRTD